MTEEDRRLLYEVHAGVVALSTKMDSIHVRVKEHELDYSETVKRVSALETGRAKILAICTFVTAVVVPAMAWMYNVLAGGREP